MSHGFIPVPNVASIELIYLWNLSVCENIIYVQKGSPYTLAQLQTLRGLIDTWDNSTWKTPRSAGCSLNRIRTRARDSFDAPAEDYSLPSPRFGSKTGNTVLPGNVTLAIKLVTGLAGRTRRGRLYYVGMVDTCLVGNQNRVDATWANSVVTALNTLLSTLASNGHTVGVVSYMEGGAWRTTGQFTAATGWVLADYNVDSMRRRLAGRGI